MEREQKQENKFVIQLITDKEEWTRIILKQTFLNPESAECVLAVWTYISDKDWGGYFNKAHIYVNKERMKTYDYPEGGVDCKIVHETIEAELVCQGLSRQKAHRQAKEAEYRKAKNLGILDSYSGAEDRFDSANGLRKERALRRKILRRLRKETP